MKTILTVGEEIVAGAALAAMVVLLIVEILFRPQFGFGIAGSLEYVRHLTLWVAMLGAALAARNGRLLALATGSFLRPGTARTVAETTAAAIAATVSAVLCVGAIALIVGDYRLATGTAAGVPKWVAALALPIGFGLIAFRTVTAAPGKWGRTAATLGLATGSIVATTPWLVEGTPAWPWVALMVVAAALGAPLFAVLGGLAVFLFMTAGVPPVSVLIQANSLTTDSTLPAVAVFTLAGFLLAAGDTPVRLLRIFRACFGWLPGGTAVVCAVVSAFFAVFTGGSGVTILALGGLLLPALLRDGYRDRFSVGLLTGSGSLGLLLPPALPLILYGIVSQTSIPELFRGGVLPGLLMIALVAAYGMREGARHNVRRTPFDLREAVASLWHGKWEFLLPVFVLAAFFGGYATILETSALTALYAFIVQVGIHRNVGLGADLRAIFANSVATIGGVLIILAVAVGFSEYLVDANVPAQLVEWTRAYVGSRAMFLITLNVFLLGVGCFMDIFSAIFVVAPLVAPLGAEFGVHPVHLGIVFIANLELGYLTPPVGLNLFLASYRFERPLIEVCRASLVFLAILAIGVLLITYVPWLTTAFLSDS
jgi:C4-dicarboxylate transporter, DctM subunit